MRISTVLAGAAALAFLGGIAAAQADRQWTYPVQSFDEISAAGPHRIVVAVGGGPSVRATGADATLDKMEAVVEQGELRIRPKEQYRRNFSWRNLPPATFYVSTPGLEGVSLAGSGDMTVDRVRGGRFHASVSGSGRLDLGDIQVDETTFSIAGSGTVTARGRADTAEVSLAGSGDFRGHGLASRTASVNVAGSGNAELSASDRAAISIVGSGGVRIAGRASCTISRIGSGRARCNA